MQFRFADFVLDSTARELQRGGRLVSIESKVFDLLVELLAARGRVVGHHELLAAVWPETATGESSLSRAVSLARAALDDRADRSLIETVRGRGYRMRAEVETVGADGEPSPAWGPFVGRERERERLGALVTRLLEGKGAAAIVRGEPGIGKSRLVEEWSRSAQARGCELWWGRSPEGAATSAFGPWVQQLEQHFERLGPRRARELVAGELRGLRFLLPGLASELPASDPAHVSTWARRELFDAVSKLLRRAASMRPLALVFDDLHAADAESLLLLQHVAAERRETALLVIGTYRDTELSGNETLARTLAILARHFDACEEIDLAGLSAEEALSFARKRGDDLSEGAVARLHARSEGNPFFLQALLAHEVRGGSRLPEGIRQVVRLRLARLSPGCLDVLRAAAVIGREFALPVLARASRVPAREVERRLHEAEQQGIIQRVALVEHRFVHVLIRDVLFQDLSPELRSDLHRRVGRALERRFEGAAEPPLEDLARHFSLAGAASARLAIEYAEKAGDRDRSRLAFESAAAHYAAARRVLRAHAPGEVEAECRLLIRLGEMQHHAGAYAEAEESVMDAIRIARRTGDVRSQARAADALSFWRLGSTGRVPRERIEAMEEVLAALGEEDLALRARVSAGLSTDLYWSDEFDRSNALSAEALALARRAGDPSTLLVALDLRHHLLVLPEHLDEREQVDAELLALARDRREPEFLFYAHKRAAHHCVSVGDDPGAEQELQRCDELANRMRLRKFLAEVRTMRAQRALYRGEFRDAEHLITPPESDGGHTPEVAFLAFVPQLFSLREALGGWEALEGPLRTGVERFPRVVALRGAWARFLLRKGRDDEAIAELEQLAADGFAALHPALDYTMALALLCEIAARTRSRHGAALYERMRGYAGRTVGLDAITCMGAADRYLALLAAAAGRSDEALARLASAQVLHERLGAQPWIARTLRDRAALLRERGEQDAAAAEVAAAEAIEQRLGMAAQG